MAGWETLTNDPRSTDDLFELALADEDEHGDAAPMFSAVVVLQHRPTPEVLHRAIELCASFDQDERLVGVAVLAELQETFAGPTPAFVDESVAALMELADRETDEEVLGALARAFGYRHDPRPLSLLLAWIDHPSQPVRFGVACSLPACALPGTEPLVAEALIHLTRDESGAVRDYALFGFPQLSLDTTEIRQAILDRVDDVDCSAAGQALVNLAALGDRRAIVPLIRYLDADRGPYGVEAAALFADPRLVPALRAAAVRSAGGDAWQSAIAACESGSLGD